MRNSSMQSFHIIIIFSNINGKNMIERQWTMKFQSSSKWPQETVFFFILIFRFDNSNLHKSELIHLIRFVIENQLNVFVFYLFTLILPLRNTFELIELVDSKNVWRYFTWEFIVNPTSATANWNIVQLLKVNHNQYFK